MPSRAMALMFSSHTTVRTHKNGATQDDIEKAEGLSWSSTEGLKYSGNLVGWPLS